MYNVPYFIPGYNPTMMIPNFTRGLGTNTMLNTAQRLGTNPMLNTAKTSTGLLSRLGSSLSGIKSINWGGLINNTSKTLGIINQTIPLVKQVGPVVNNMKSMIRVASLFKDETDIFPKNNYYQPPKTTNQSTPPSKTTTIKTTTTNQSLPINDYNSSPTFFINT